MSTSTALDPLQTALVLAEAGLSVIPIRPDKSKAPSIGAWKEYQSRIPSEAEIRNMFCGGCGLAIVGGKASGNLEIIDVEKNANFPEFCDLINEHAPGLLDTLIHVETPSGGHHLFYRCDEIEGNLKLAMRLGDDGRPEVLIETRGQGGYVLTISSPPDCHEDHREYRLVRNRLTQILRITPEQRSIILASARSFHQIRNEKVAKGTTTGSSNGNGTRPGEVFAERVSWPDILENHGWSHVAHHDEEWFWRRPGKSTGFSATTNYKGNDLFYVFSTNADPFQHETSYSKFYAYALLDHGGDTRTAARTLAKRYDMEPRNGGNGRGRKEDRQTEPDEESVSDESQVVLDYSGKTPRANLNNVVKLLEQDPKLTGLVHFDTFLQRLVTGDPPREWTDADDIHLMLEIQRNKGIPNIGREAVSQAVIAVASKNASNCVRDWLTSLSWDREPRIDNFFEDHFGADANEYTLAASKNFWISLVARVSQPGCQVDNMIVLEGSQGIKKSSSLRVIGGDWFTEQHESVTGKGFCEVLQGKLLVEISEMDAFRKAEVTRVKQTITNLSDRYREAYGRYAKDHPRQCVFVGTTNRDDWNRDETGARRFWPITCRGDVDIDAIQASREQLFAEAVHRFKAGETWWNMPVDQTKVEQAKRYDADVWTEPIEEFLARKDEVTVDEVLTDGLKFEIGRMSRFDQMRVATCLRVSGWKKVDARVSGRVRKVWKRP